MGTKRGCAGLREELRQDVRAVPDAEEVDEQAERLVALLLDLAGQPHQWLGELVERLAAARASQDVAKLQELLELAADSCSRSSGDGGRFPSACRCPSRAAQILDDLPLLRRKPAHPFLVIGRELVGHLLERTGQLVERLARDEPGQDDVDPVVASSEMMDRADARAPLGGRQKRDQVGLLAMSRDPAEQVDSVGCRERTEMLRSRRSRRKVAGGS